MQNRPIIYVQYIYIFASQCELSERTDRASCCSLFIYFDKFLCDACLRVVVSRNRQRTVLSRSLCRLQPQLAVFLDPSTPVPVFCPRGVLSCRRTSCSHALCPGTLRNALLQNGTALSWHKSLRLTSIQSIVPLGILEVMFEMLICPDSLNYDKVMTVVRMSFPDPYVVKARYLCCVDVVPSLSLPEHRLEQV